MKKVLLIDPFSGASGDMFLAVLVDLGGYYGTHCDVEIRPGQAHTVGRRFHENIGQYRERSFGRHTSSYSY